MPTSEDIVYKLGRLIGDTTVSGDVAVSTSGISPTMAKRGGIGSAKECPEGFRWSDEDQACLPTSKLKEGVSSGVALGMLEKELDKIKSQKMLDIWWIELGKGNKYWKALNSTSKKSLLRKVKQIEKEKAFESTSVFGAYGNDNVTVAGSGQTRVGGDKENEIDVLKREPRPMKFNTLLGIYLPGEEEEDMDAPDEEPVEEGKRGKGRRPMSISGQKGWAKLSKKLGLDKKDGGEGKLEPWNPNAKKTFDEWGDLMFPTKEKKREQEAKKKKAKQKFQNAKINLAAFRSMMESD